MNLKLSIIERTRRKTSKKSNNLDLYNKKEIEEEGKKNKQKNKIKNKKGKENEIKEIILQTPINKRKKKNSGNPPIKKKNKARKRLKKNYNGNKNDNLNNIEEIIQTNKIESKEKKISSYKNNEEIVANAEKVMV